MTVIKFTPVEVGDGFRLDPDQILEAAKGQGFTTLVIMGELEDGSPWLSGTDNAGETLLLLERIKHQLVMGEL